MNFSRRNFFQAVAGAGGLAALRAQMGGPGTPPLTFTQEPAAKSGHFVIFLPLRKRIICRMVNNNPTSVFDIFQKKTFFWTKDDKYRFEVYTGITGSSVGKKFKYYGKRRS